MLVVVGSTCTCAYLVKTVLVTTCTNVYLKLLIEMEIHC